MTAAAADSLLVECASSQRMEPLAFETLLPRAAVGAALVASSSEPASENIFQRSK